MREEQELRKNLESLLEGGEAHIELDTALDDWPEALRGVRPHGAPHSAWELLEHMRIAQWDILEFSRNPEHRSPDFPSGYWPPSSAPPDAAAWERSVEALRKDREALRALAGAPPSKLFARVSHPEAEERHTLLREVLLAADHNAYHLGQLVLLRRMLGAWQG
jgi:hypothetical protein